MRISFCAFATEPVFFASPSCTLQHTNRTIHKRYVNVFRPDSTCPLRLFFG